FTRFFHRNSSNLATMLGILRQGCTRATVGSPHTASPFLAVPYKVPRIVTTREKLSATVACAPVHSSTGVRAKSLLLRSGQSFFTITIFTLPYRFVLYNILSKLKPQGAKQVQWLKISSSTAVRLHSLMGIVV